MRFSYKILFCSILIMAVSFGVGGYVFVDDVFQTSLERETKQAKDESSILQFAFETAALNIPSKYDMLQNSVIEEIGANLERGGQGRLLRLLDEQQKVVYASEGFVEDTALLDSVGATTRAWRVISLQGNYYIQTGTMVTTLDRILYLETMRDVTSVYAERDRGFAVYRNITLLILVFSSVLMYFISSWLTKPIRLLTQAAKKMTAGDYGYRAEQISLDEMGQLTCDFNHMAGVLEENIHKLEDEIRAREDFIAAFSHELKTPLTAVIGYADLLRSRKLDEEKQFLSANYIYTEGKRLEAMSFRLLELIVTKRNAVKRQEEKAESLFAYLEDVYREEKNIRLNFQYEPGVVNVEIDLLKTVLINLVDNACKASKEGDLVEILGEQRKKGYYIAVRDEGVGIPPEECKKITEAFYMVDKSRSRSHNGAGLGLALCAEILKLHGSELMIESTLGKGSCFSFLLTDKEAEADGEEENHTVGGAAGSSGGIFGAGTGTDRPL